MLTAREFFESLPVVVAPKLPFELRSFHTAGGRGRLLKLHYGRPEAHFEVWHHSAAGRLEVGLHFEGAADLNARALEHFRPRMVEVKAELPRAELEPWDRGWVRLYETIPAANLSDQVLAPAGELLAAYVRTLQPMLNGFLETTEGA